MVPVSAGSAGFTDGTFTIFRYREDSSIAYWRKSSHSGGGNGGCVEVAFATQRVGVRDSKNISGPTLAFNPTAWLAFTRKVA